MSEFEYNGRCNCAACRIKRMRQKARLLKPDPIQSLSSWKPALPYSPEQGEKEKARNDFKAWREEDSEPK